MTVPDLPPYEPREVTFHGVERDSGRVVKLYGIALDGGTVTEAALDEARRRWTEAVPPASSEDGVYGVGHVIVHEGRHAVWTLVQWWRDEDAVEQVMLRAPLGRPADAAVHGTRVIGCAWELAVTGFERDAWVREVLQGNGEGRLDRYLEATLEGPV